MSQRRGEEKRLVSEHSVLAETFVPEELRRINHFPVTVSLFAGQRVDGASIVGPKGLIVPFVPVCYCNGTDSKQVFMGEPLHTFPIPRTVPPNLYYAIQHRLEKLEQSPSSVLDASLGEHGNGSSNQAASTSLTSLDDVNCLEEYVKVWESILDMERTAVLLKYERFSQYSKTMKIQTAAENPTGINTSVAVQHAQPMSLVKIEIHGIADASPSIMIGDIVLLRPMQPLSLPFPNQPSRPLEKLSWSSASNVVEIHSTVQQVLRGFGLRKDAIRIAWLGSSDYAMILYSMKAFSRIPESYNVRFIPSSVQHERCLTALDWLLSCFREHSQTAMIEFLFPTKAPADIISADHTEVLDVVHAKQLNHKQLSFVKLMLSRSLQPSKGPIRGPLVLTGPAGTGM
jgi:hypothetical protein